MWSWAYSSSFWTFSPCTLVWPIGPRMSISPARRTSRAISLHAYAGPTEQVRQNVTAVVADVHALQPAAAVLIFGYWNVVEDGDVGRKDYGDDGVAEAAAATKDCNDALRKAAAGAVYVDTTTAVKGDSGEEDPTGLLAADGDHPNAAGHAAIAAAAYAALPHG